MQRQQFIYPFYLFSYWIFAWVILFLFCKKWKPKIQIPNPILALGFGILENILTILLFIYNHVSLKIIIAFTIILIIIKIIPFILLLPYPILVYRDILWFVILFGIYNFVLWMNNTNIVFIYLQVYDSIIKENNQTPFMYVFSRLKNSKNI